MSRLKLTGGTSPYPHSTGRGRSERSDATKTKEQNDERDNPLEKRRQRDVSLL